MTGDSRRITLDISEHLFRLTTESLRLHSNETMLYQDLNSLLNKIILAESAVDSTSPETMRDHLSVIPTEGDIRIDVSITNKSADNLDRLKRQLGSTLGVELTVGETLSIMLFHYVVAQKASSILGRLGLDDPAIGSSEIADTSRPKRIVKKNS